MELLCSAAAPGEKARDQLTNRSKRRFYDRTDWLDIDERSEHPGRS
jgi:hypothetical protein